MGLPAYEDDDCTDADAERALFDATNQRLDLALAWSTIHTPEPLKDELTLLTKWAQSSPSRAEVEQIHARAGVLVNRMAQWAASA